MRKMLHYAVVLSLLLLLPPALQAQERTLTGSVLSAEDNSPLAGVTIRVKGTANATQTDADGNFRIQITPGQTLEVSYVGYEDQEITPGNSNALQIRMRVAAGSLGEVVVTAMGIKKERKALGYSVSELNAEELMKNKNTNIVNSLAGKVPGVNITQFSGAAGAGASITIRGGNSTSESRQNQPLFVIDGVIY
ncbi:MAG TPA: carboxypeptidase-like regulatory domain-containing protein, partial [Agriterribacter sp.]|nr:carboxypeptidase-like regulatory domain-containing protein [Agriterribacter sp.]